MKAIAFDKVGGTEVLELVSVSDPRPAPGEVLVKVKACAVNRLDYYLRIEEDDAMPMPHIAGSDVAGEVAQLGTGVTGWTVGDSVIVCPTLSCGECSFCRSGQESDCESVRILGYQTQGGYAEYVVVPARNLIQKPSKLTYEEAASIPLVFITSYHQMFTRGSLRVGDTALIMGASSGIGSAAAQLAKVAGARVISTVGGREKFDRAYELGVDLVVDHRQSDWTKAVLEATGGKGVDIVCEHFGGEYFTKCLDLLRQGGRLITIGYTTTSNVQIDLSSILHKQVTVGTSYLGSKMELEEVVKLFEWGKLQPVIAEVMPLERAREAHDLLESRKFFGKIVLKVA